MALSQEEIIRQKMENGKNMKQVYSEDLDKVFVSPNEAVQYVLDQTQKVINVTNIIHVCKDRELGKTTRKTAGGYHWEYV